MKIETVPALSGKCPVRVWEQPGHLRDTHWTLGSNRENRPETAGRSVAGDGWTVGTLTPRGTDQKEAWQRHTTNTTKGNKK